MSINEKDANKYICYLAANMWRFPFWAQKRRAEADGDRDNGHIDYRDNQDRCRH